MPISWVYTSVTAVSPNCRAPCACDLVLDVRYPSIIQEAKRTIGAMHRTGKVGVLQRAGCVEISSYWQHWPCVFPQHGPGRKHLRRIELAPWQKMITDRQAPCFLRGLIHSDGCRSLNRVNGGEYPRYIFTNTSSDILKIFCDACETYGVAFRRMRWNAISVARRPDVTKLDRVIGPKS